MALACIMARHSGRSRMSAVLLCGLLASCHPGPTPAQRAAAQEQARVAAAAQRGAERATHYRQGICASLQASLQRLDRDHSAQQAAADLASVRFLLGNMLGAYPPNSVAPDSKLRPEALSHPDKIAALQDAASRAAAAMSQATTAEGFAQARQNLTAACMACHTQITHGVQLVAAQPQS